MRMVTQVCQWLATKFGLGDAEVFQSIFAISTQITLQGLQGQWMLLKLNIM